MFIDARTVEQNSVVQSDVCIVGAGVSGITLGLELRKAGFTTCIIESGGFEPHKATQSLYYGDNVGIPYYPLDTARGRLFGGTSHFWGVEMPGQGLGVRLRPMDAIDFEVRDWVPYSGWPFSIEHLGEFYDRAHGLLNIGPNTYDPADWSDGDERMELPFVGSRVQTTMFQFAFRDLFFKDFRQLLDRAGNVKVLVNGNVVEIVTDEAGRNVTRLEVACLDGRSFSIRARLFILAMGGIEVPRLLLLSNGVQPNGLGNQKDLVGRFFMEHPHLWAGEFVPAHAAVTNGMGLYEIFQRHGTAVMGKIAIGENTLREERLLNWVASIHPNYNLSRQYYLGHNTPGVSAFRRLKGSLVRDKRLPEGAGQCFKDMLLDGKSIARTLYRRVRGDFASKFRRAEHPAICLLNHMVEQAPNPRSRVMLGHERDALGQCRAKLDWQLTDLDCYTYTRAQEILNEEFRRAGLGSLVINTKADEVPAGIHGGWHHMGTTRMHRDPQFGVVDENCKVHGLANLFVAGASVFPTSGYANPVLTTIALVLRLADHVKAQMGISAQGLDRIRT